MTSPIERTYAFRIGYRQARAGREPYGEQFMTPLSRFVYAIGRLQGMIDRAEDEGRCQRCGMIMKHGDAPLHFCSMKGGE